ncbi:MAG: hypothetical protein ACC657_10015 [Thiohalomonadales bacterium]
MGILQKIIISGLLILINSNLLVHAGDHEYIEKSDTEQLDAISREMQQDELYSLFTKVIGTQNPEDQFRLGRMYQLGNGVERDDVQAYVWTALSLTNGYPGASKTLRDLEGNMSSYEVNYAIDLLRKMRELR